MTRLRTFEPNVVWSFPDGRLTPRAQGFLNELYRYIGGVDGVIPGSSLGGDGSLEKFLRADGAYAVPVSPGNPTASVGLAAQNGTAATFMRSDAAPAISLAIVPTWTGRHNFAAGIDVDDVSAVSLTTTSFADIGGAFGCNGATPQTTASANAAVSGTAGGSYTGTEQTMLNDIKALLNQIRAALVANGIMT